MAERSIGVLGQKNGYLVAAALEMLAVAQQHQPRAGHPDAHVTQQNAHNGAVSIARSTLLPEAQARLAERVAGRSSTDGIPVSPDSCHRFSCRFTALFGSLARERRSRCKPLG